VISLFNAGIEILIVVPFLMQTEEIGYVGYNCDSPWSQEVTVRSLLVMNDMVRQTKLPPAAPERSSNNPKSKAWTIQACDDMTHWNHLYIDIVQTYDVKSFVHNHVRSGIPCSESNL
jgi:hypothetical protein